MKFKTILDVVYPDDFKKIRLQSGKFPLYIRGKLDRKIFYEDY